VSYGGRKIPTQPVPASGAGAGARVLAIVIALTVVGWGWWFYSRWSNRPSTPPVETALFRPTVENTTHAFGTPPPGMVWIPGGEFSMGAAQSPDLNPVGMQATTDSRPVHRVYVDGFWMDTTEVTNAEFTKFVTATGYVTIAERTPRAEDFPGAPPENLVAGAVVFSPPDHAVPLDDHMQWWSYVKHADWRHPEGPTTTTTTWWRLRSGPASVCPRKRSGSSPRAVAKAGSCTRGAMSSRRAAGRWRTHFKATFPTTTRAMTAVEDSARSRSFRRTATVSSTSRGTSGNG
jgi:sulfatase-modifying factor enzyme 1